jgi:hypothetical protein
MMSKEDEYYERNDLLLELKELLDTPGYFEYCNAQLMQAAIDHITQLRQCVAQVRDAYSYGDHFSEGHKRLVLSEKWLQWARECLRHHHDKTAKAGGDDE